MVKPLNVSTMNTRKKYILMILLLISCPIGIIAQTSYYYYKGKQIPLTLNDSKVCVSIPKDKGDARKELLKDIQVLDTIRDDIFDISIIQQSEYNKLSTSKSVLFSPSYKTKDGEEVFLTPYINIRLKREQDVGLLTSFAERYGLRIVKQDRFMPLWYILSVSSNTGKNALDVANELWESGYFAASEPDLSAKDLLCSNDPNFNQQWGLYNGDNPGVDISVCSAWNYSTGKDVKIAFLDTGVDLHHVDLADNICSLSYNTETSSSPSIIYGDHATHCAGIAAAVKDNGIQIAGVASDATIISISNKMNATTTNIQMKLANGINWAYQHGADIISNSWYYPTPYAAIDEAIYNAFKYGRHGKGCIVVFASGNKRISDANYNVKYPANCNDTILAVGSIENTGVKASTSCYGEKLDLVAPGVGILSTLPNDTIGYKNGTSMACPHVAGVAALILERNSELTVTQVNSIINSNAKKISGVNFNVTKPDGLWNEKYGYGLVDAYSSVINTPGIAYIQNDTITGTRIVSADSIYVGKDVTDTKEHGNVILGQGDIIMKAGYVKIKNSTIVPLETKLIIRNQ